MLRDYGNELSAAGGDAITVTAFTPANKAQGIIADSNLAAPVARDWGIGEVTKFFGWVTQAFNNLTSLDIELIGADDSAESVGEHHERTLSL